MAVTVAGRRPTPLAEAVNNVPERKSADSECMSLQKEGKTVRHRSSYGERGYAFGQRLLTLRTRLGLTQAQLGERLQVSARAVGEWEGGLIPTCVLRCHSEMRKIGHRTKTLGILFKL